MNKRGIFEVYTYFGRVVFWRPIGKDETHHKPQEDARKYLLNYERETGHKAWIRYV